MMALLACAPERRPAKPIPVAPDSAVARIRQEARAMTALVETGWVKDWLAGSDQLPPRAARTVYVAADRSRAVDEETWRALPEAERASLAARTFDEAGYYETGYGTPIAYARAYDLVGRAGLSGVAGKKVLDFGYGEIGGVHLLALAGADVTGVDVDPILAALYSQPDDTGRMGHGRATIVTGRWPAEDAARRAVGGGYTLIVSKNVLKRGYVHPAEPTDPRKTIDLGVDDEAFVRALHEALVPGGWLVIYNLAPAPAPPGQPYIPWADGRTPFPRETLERAGFEVLTYDADDSPFARDMARTLGWDREGMDVERDLFGTYTLARRTSR